MSTILPKQILPTISNELRLELESKGNFKKVLAGDVILKENASIRSITILKPFK